MQIYIFLGAPGAGKGSVAKMLVDHAKLTHVSTGDLFRKNISEKTELGKKASEYIEKGLLVPDELTCDMVEDRIVEEDCKQGFILDGFPRNLKQAEVLQEMFDRHNMELTSTVLLHVDEEILVERLSGRRVCTNCGESYNLAFKMPAKEGVCDRCGGEVIQRPDDTEETVRQRLHTYHEQTEPLIDYYKKQDKLLTVPNEGSLEQTFADLLKAIGQE